MAVFDKGDDHNITYTKIQDKKISPTLSDTVVIYGNVNSKSNANVKVWPNGHRLCYVMGEVKKKDARHFLKKSLGTKN